MSKKLTTFFVAVGLLTGCSSTKNQNENRLSDAQIQSALASAKPPQQFGFTVYPTQDGIAMNGNARLHPLHVASEKFMGDAYPIIKMEGSAARMKLNALIDTSSADSWFEYKKAMEFRTSFLGLDNRTIPYRGSSYIGEVPAYAAVIPQLRINQLFIENSPVYVRMATGSLGPLVRGIEKPQIDAIIGFDILRNFEYVQIDLMRKTINFSSTEPYTTNDERLIGEAFIVNAKGAGLAVQGDVSGKETPILLDFAGNYSFALPNANVNTTKQVDLGEVVYINTPTVRAVTADGLPRAGQQMLRKFIVTICPRTRVVYFERPTL